MKPISLPRSRDRAVDMFGMGVPTSIVRQAPGAEIISVITSGKAKPKIHFEDPLFLGDVCRYGAKVIGQIISSKAKVLRGRDEDIVLKVLEEEPDIAIPAAQIWGQIIGGEFLSSCIEGRDVADVTTGMVTDAKRIPAMISSGSIPLEDGRNAIRKIVGPEIIAWLQSLPVALVFPSSHDPEKCWDVGIISRGSPEWKWPVTEDAAIWSDPSETSSPSQSNPTVLYELFGDKVARTNKARGGYNPATGSWDQDGGTVSATRGDGAQPMIRSVPRFGDDSIAAVFSQNWEKLFSITTPETIMKETIIGPKGRR